MSYIVLYLITKKKLGIMDETKKRFLCIENGVKFVIYAKDMDEAKDILSISTMWNASVIGEIKTI